VARRSLLMIPGPVDVWDDTLEALGKPITPHYGDRWVGLYWETIGLLKQVFQTSNDVFILPSSGSGAIDACLGSMFRSGEKIAAVCNGPFMNRTIEILDGYGIEVVRVESEWGKAADVEKMRRTLESEPDIAGLAVVGNDTGTGARNPIRELAQLAHEHDLPIVVDAISGMGGYNIPVDEWDLDAVCVSSNKCLESPPGLGIVSVSPRAWRLIDGKKNDRHHGWFLNLSVWKEYAQSPDWAKWHPYPMTLATSVILALRTSLKRIVEQETLEGHWARLAWAQGVVRSGLQNIGFRMVAADEVSSPTVTCVWKRDDMEVDDFIGFMDREHGFMVAGGTWDLAGKVFRVSHMGKASTKEYLLPFLLGIEDYLRRRGEDVAPGASLIGLSSTDKWY
jgi:alanine-glyoxylate transaminase / serine-glyoxylate transaminase / serine-pyruvate transaminase